MGRHFLCRHHRDDLPVRLHRCLLLPRLHRQGLSRRDPGLARRGEAVAGPTSSPSPDLLEQLHP
jgi:hypothetical protein